MSSLLPAMMDRCVALIEGSYTPTRAIASGRFKHVPFLVQSALPEAVKAPYPFETLIGETVVPGDAPTTLSSDQIWSETRVDVNVLYAAYPDARFEREKTIQRDIYSLRRTLSDVDSWDSLTGFSCAKIGNVFKERVDLLGDIEEQIDIAYILTVELSIVYREDYTT
jgi:hypothetical protein